MTFSEKMNLVRESDNGEEMMNRLLANPETSFAQALDIVVGVIAGEKGLMQKEDI